MWVGRFAMQLGRKVAPISLALPDAGLLGQMIDQLRDNPN
jgi:hypothetical protein